METVVIAGASGFVGSALRASLGGKYLVRALSRDASRPEEPGVSWRRCDIYSLLQTEQALLGADLAVYLVHSMLPSARLSQGSFADFDLLAADNFARAAVAAGIKRIVYVGGLVPGQRPLSAHLASRLEVEKALARYGVPVATLRCGLIVGPGGSSLRIMTRLVEKLPLMLCPSWTGTKSAPVDLRDVLQAIEVFLADETFKNSKQFDLGGPEILSYREMMGITAEEFGLRRRMIPLPLLSPTLSRLWVTMMTGAPKSLLKPLIESLRHDMVPDPARQVPAAIPQIRFRDSVAQLRSEQVQRAQAAVQQRPRAFSRSRASEQERSVRSVQRVEMPADWTVAQLAEYYFRWVDAAIPGMQVVSAGVSRRMYVRGIAAPMLILERSAERCSADRDLWYIRGGLLAAGIERARVEFRQIEGRPALIAIHDYVPALHWYLYRWSQALVHLLVMRKFAHHLTKAQLPVQADYTT